MAVSIDVSHNRVSGFPLHFITLSPIAPFQILYSEALPTTALHDTVSELIRRSATGNSTVSKGLAQGPFEASRVGFEVRTCDRPN